MMVGATRSWLYAPGGGGAAQIVLKLQVRKRAVTVAGCRSEAIRLAGWLYAEASRLRMWF